MMPPISPVATDAVTAFNKCLSGLSDVKDADLKRRMCTSITALQSAESSYRAVAGTCSFFQLPSSDHMEDVSADEMSALYEKQMSAEKGKARDIYNAIRAISDKCPFCGCQFTRTVDHYLPKKKYPAFAVNPINLIPACRDCNTHKGTHWPLTAEEQLIHPYFDDFSTFRWLYAAIKTPTMPIVEYSVHVPSGQPASVGKRLKKHFDKLKLGELYSLYAATEVCDISGRLDQLYITGGEVDVASHLSGAANSCLAILKNSWKSALYVALANDSSLITTQGWRYFGQ